MQNTLIQSLSHNIADNYRGQDLIETNQKLSQALNKIEHRNSNLENLIKELKKYETIYKSSISIQCAACNKLVYSQQFEEHKLECTEANWSV